MRWPVSEGADAGKLCSTSRVGKTGEPDGYVAGSTGGMRLEFGECESEGSSGSRAASV
jgi:hypothetical protein